MDELMEAIEAAISFKTPRAAIAKELELPISTLDDYIRRIEAKWKAEAEPTKGDARKAAVRRITRIVRSAFVGGKYRDAISGELLLAKLEGTEQSARLEIGGIPPAPGGAGGAPIAITTADDAIAALKRLAKETT